MKPRRSHFRTVCSRRGAALVEGALVLGVFSMLLLGTLDLALAVLRDNSLREASRRVARAAIVRGSASGSLFTPWGPTTFEGTASGSSEIAAICRRGLVAVPAGAVRLRVEWPDGTNDEGDRVQVTLTTAYRPIVTSLFGRHAFDLTATSTMRIEH